MLVPPEVLAPLDAAKGLPPPAEPAAGPAPPLVLANGLLPPLEEAPPAGEDAP